MAEVNTRVLKDDAKARNLRAMLPIACTALAIGRATNVSTMLAWLYQTQTQAQPRVEVSFGFKSNHDQHSALATVVGLNRRHAYNFSTGGGST